MDNENKIKDGRTCARDRARQEKYPSNETRARFSIDRGWWYRRSQKRKSLLNEREGKRQEAIGAKLEVVRVRVGVVEPAARHDC